MARTRALLGSLLLACMAAPAAAQTVPAPAVEFTAGHAGFADESVINHLVAGAAVRWPVTRRVSVGPELQYMVGPRSDRDLFLTGNITFDLRRPGGRTTPFVVVGAGLFRHSNSFGGRPFSASEPALTVGGGIRTWLSDRAYATIECRVGWEPHYRVTGTIGIALSR